MADVQARVNAEGYVAQRFDTEFNGQGNWLLVYKVDGNLTATIYTDDDVADWPRLVPEEVSG